MSPLVRATPFHSRASAANLLNTWEARGGWTLASAYGDAHAEALALRTTCAFADISWRWRVAIEGARAEEFLSRLMTKDPAQLSPGAAFKALWLSDKGGLRGAGVLARHGRESFQLTAASSDLDWVARGAALFDVGVREIGEDEGGLAIVGPYAGRVLEAAGLDGMLEPLAFRKVFWRGLDITVSRFGEHGGYEIWCKADDASLLWDRIVKAGAGFALMPAGLKAMDIADLEAGVPRPERDYEPARDGFAAEPAPNDLGLEPLVDADHMAFNGRTTFLAVSKTRIRVGVEFDNDVPAPHATLMRGGQVVGKTMNSLFSPALQRAIALAVVDSASAIPGTELTVLGKSARVAALPFLSVSEPVADVPQKT